MSHNKQNLEGLGMACVIYLGPHINGLEPQQRMEFICRWLHNLIKGIRQRIKRLEDNQVTTQPPAPTTSHVYWGWFADDPYSELQSVDSLAYNKNAFITPNANIEADFHLVPEGHYIVLKEPISERVKMKWSDTGSVFNSGDIPDSRMRAPFENNGYRYYVSRTAIQFSSSTNARVLFS